MLIDDIPSSVTYEYTGVRTFSINFPFYGTESIRMGFRESGAPTLAPYTELVKDVDFTVTGTRAGVGDSEIAFISGKAVLTDAGVLKLSTGNVIAVYRDTPATQLYAYNEYDNFPAKSHENALGRLTTVAQELSKKVATSIVIPPGSDVSGEEVLNDILVAADAANAAAIASETNADLSNVEANRAKAEADRARIDADRSAADADRSAAEADRAEAAAAAAYGVYQAGESKWLSGTKLDHNWVWPDRSLVLFGDWPDLKARFDGGYIGTCAEADAINFPGLFAAKADGSGLYLPDIGGLFARAWRPGEMNYDKGRTAGSFQYDAIRKIKGNYSHVQGFTGGGTASGAMTKSLGGGKIGYAVGTAQEWVSIGIDTSLAVPTADDNRPQNYAQPMAIYLGRNASEV